MGRRDFFEERKLKRLIYIFATTLVISIIAFITIFVMYNRKLKDEANNQLLELSKMSDIVPNEDLKDYTQASSSSDKNIAEAKNNTVKEEKKKSTSKTPVDSTVNKKTNTVNNTVSNTNTVNNAAANTVGNVVNNSAINEISSTTTESVEANLAFCAPVSGEIIKDFAKDTLIYSNTLEEWTTHMGIDIKAPKTTIVVASEKGTVESIKSDPRFGLSITIVHEGGFKTIYSNLLTTEFVSEGECVEKGQTIATVGETSSFEIADEPHLHFEICKNGEYLNPTIYLKDM